MRGRYSDCEKGGSVRMTKAELLAIQALAEAGIQTPWTLSTDPRLDLLKEDRQMPGDVMDAFAQLIEDTPSAPSEETAGDWLLPAGSVPYLDSSGGIRIRTPYGDTIGKDGITDGAPPGCAYCLGYRCPCECADDCGSRAPWCPMAEGYLESLRRTGLYSESELARLAESGHR